MKYLTLGSAIAFSLLVGCSPEATPPTATPSAARVEHGHDHTQGRPIRLKPEQLQQAGVEVAAVTLRELGSGVKTTGVLEADPDRQVTLSSRVAGVVTRLYVRLGEPVAAGSKVAEIESPELAQAKADYHHSLVESELAQKNLSNRKRLAQLGDETQRPLEEARAEVASSEAEVKTRQAREEVARLRLQRLESLLEDGIASLQQFEEARADLRQARAELTEAKTALSIAQRHLAREVEVRRQGLRVSREVWDAQASAARTEEDLRHSRELLELLGASPETHEGTLRVTTPLGGQVTARPARRGQRVEAGEALVTVTDLSKLWLWVDLYDRDLSQVRQGMRATVTMTAYPARTFTGSLDYIDPSVEKSTRTTRGLVVLENREGLLKPGMYAEVSLQTTSEMTVAVPNSALVAIDGQDVVYVSDRTGEFERRPVKILRQGPEYASVEGLQAGEKVAISGTFAIKSVDQQEKMGGHQH